MPVKWFSFINYSSGKWELIFLLLLTFKIFNKEYKWTRIMVYAGGAITLALLMIPLHAYWFFERITVSLVFFNICFCMITVIRAMLKRQPLAYILFTAYTVTLLTVTYDLIYQYNYIDLDIGETNYWGIVVLSVTLSIILIKRYAGGGYQWKIHHSCPDGKQ